MFSQNEADPHLEAFGNESLLYLYQYSKRGNYDYCVQSRFNSVDDFLAERLAE